MARDRTPHEERVGNQAYCQGCYYKIGEPDEAPVMNMEIQYTATHAVRVTGIPVKLELCTTCGHTQGWLTLEVLRDSELARCRLLIQHGVRTHRAFHLMQGNMMPLKLSSEADADLERFTCELKKLGWQPTGRLTGDEDFQPYGEESWWGYVIEHVQHVLDETTNLPPAVFIPIQEVDPDELAFATP